MPLSKGMQALIDNPEALEEVIVSDLSIGQLSKKHQISRRTVRGIKSGNLFADQLPHVRRPYAELNRKDLDCRNCIHAIRIHVQSDKRTRGSDPVWRCSLGLPDIDIKGVYFAADCAAFIRSESCPELD